jgi:hypothetical protein
MLHHHQTHLLHLDYQIIQILLHHLLMLYLKKLNLLLLIQQLLHLDLHQNLHHHLLLL